MILQWWIHIIIHASKLIECTTPRVNPNVNYGLWVIITCQGRFISCNKCTSLLQDVDIGRGYVCVETGYMGTVLSAQFCWEPKTALKNKVY